MSLDDNNKQLSIAGAGGGSSTPSEDRDTLQSNSYVGIIDLIGEGQIGGLVDGTKSIFLNGVQLTAESGAANFEGVTWLERVGTQDQAPITGFGEVETPFPIGVELKHGTPSTFTVTNPRVDEVRVILAIAALTKTDKDDGDIHGSSVDFEFFMSMNGSSYESLGIRSIVGKASSRYQRSYSMPLPKTTAGGVPVTRWGFQIRRITADSTTQSVVNSTFIDSYTEVITKKLSYPNSALIATRFNAEHFSAMPKREYLVDGLLIRVPKNYDEISNEYLGPWDGTFKLAASSNPAWIMYDLLLDPRYGLGEYIDPTMVDEARLYQIGQYCDQLVDDGFGKKERRYSINCVINSRAEAYDLIMDICSVFNGMAYWAGDQVGFMIDAPSDPVMAFTPANIIGEFGYAGTSLRDRHSIAAVTWNDPADNYKQAVEYVEDPELVERYGVRKVEIQAFGCTSRGQAHRQGLWMLYTEHQQAETVVFKAGADSAMLLPGDIIQIQDPDRSGQRFGGRLISCNARSATLDDAIDFGEFTNLKFAVMLEDGKFVERRIKSHSQSNIRIGSTSAVRKLTTVNWDDPLPKLPVAQAVWVISSPQLELVQARVVNIKQGEEAGTAEITAVPHNPNKYLSIENGIMLEVPLTSTLKSREQDAPKEIRVTQEVVLTQGIAKTRLVLEWDAAKNASQYLVQWKRNGGNWVSMPATASLSIEVEDIYEGTYVARVAARNLFGAQSYYTYSESADLKGKQGNPAKVASLKAYGVLFGMDLEWVYSNSKDNVSHVVIECSYLPDRSDVMLLGNFAHPTTKHSMTGLQGNLKIEFRAKVVDKNGNESEWCDWVAGTTSADPGKVLELIEGHINEGILDDFLRDKIGEGVEGNEKAGEALAAAANASRDLAAEVLNRGVELAAERKLRQDAIDLVNEGITQEITQRKTADTATLQVIDNYKTSNDTALANVRTEVQAATRENGAQASRLNAIDLRFTNTDAEINKKASLAVVSELEGTVEEIDGKVLNQGNAIIEIQGEVEQIQGEVALKANATALNDIYTKIETEDKAAQIAAGRIENYDANLVIGVVNLLSKQNAMSNVEYVPDSRSQWGYKFQKERKSFAVTLTESTQYTLSFRAKSETAQSVTVDSSGSDEPARIFPIGPSYTTHKWVFTTKTDLTGGTASFPIKPLVNWYRFYKESTALVIDPNHAAYKTVGTAGIAYTNMSQVIGGVFGSAFPTTGRLQGGIDTPSTAWAGINLAQYYRTTRDAALLPRLTAIGNFFITHAMNIKIWDMPYKAFPNSLTYNTSTGQWAKTTRAIHTRTFFHVAWSLLEIYDVTRDNRYLTLAGQLMDSVVACQMIVTGQATSNELPPYFNGAMFNTIDSLDGVNYEPSWNTFVNTSGDMVMRCTSKWIELLGNQTRSAFDLYAWDNTSYTIKSVADSYINHLVVMYNSYGLRKTTGHKLIYNFSHYEWTDPPHSSGYMIPKPMNWDFLNDVWGVDQWFTGDLMLWGILGFALAGHKAIATDLINQYYTLRAPDAAGRLLFYDRYTATGGSMPDDKSKSITFSALYMSVRNVLGDFTHDAAALAALDFYQITSTSKNVDGSYSWDSTDSTSVVENKTLGEILYAVLANSKVAKAPILLGFQSALASIATVTDIKLEKGNRATEWTSSDQDVLFEIEANAKASQRIEAEVALVDGKVQAHATQLLNLRTDVDGNSTTIEQQSTSIDGIRGVHALKINTNGVIAGYGLVSELVDGQVKSQFGVNANTFFIGAPSNGKKPFVVLTEPGKINDVIVPAGTYIDTAFLGTATIGLAHINKASIGSLSALSAELGTLVTYKDPAKPSGARMILSGSLIRVYDDNNRLRVRLGLW